VGLPYQELVALKPIALEVVVVQYYLSDFHKQ
jgi:hypothetical protein